MTPFVLGTILYLMFIKVIPKEVSWILYQFFYFLFLFVLEIKRHDLCLRSFAHNFSNKLKWGHDRAIIEFIRQIADLFYSIARMVHRFSPNFREVRSLPKSQALAHKSYPSPQNPICRILPDSSN